MKRRRKNTTILDPICPYLSKRILKELGLKFDEVITFDNNLPAVDVCCVYIDDFLTSATNKFIEMLTSGVKGE